MAVGPSNALTLRHWKMRGGDKPSIFQKHRATCEAGVASGSATGLATVMRGRGDRDRRFPTAQNYGRSLLLDIPALALLGQCGLKGRRCLLVRGQRRPKFLYQYDVRPGAVEDRFGGLRGASRRRA
jgi:hypothetical protein